MTEHPRIFTLIVAAGVGRRAGGASPKQYQPIAGKPMLAHSVASLASHPAIAGVQVVIHPEHAEYYAQAVEYVLSRPHSDLQPSAEESLGQIRSLPRGETKPVSLLAAKLLPPIHGGAERADSVAAGLASLAQHNPDYVLIHDAARPFITHAMIDRILAALTPETGVVPAIAVPDTVRRYENGQWSDVARDGLMRIQTPQAFAFKALRAMLEGGIAPHASLPPSADAARHGRLRTPEPAAPTDDAAIWLAAGHKLAYVAGDEELRKVTTAEDIVWANARAGARRIAVGMGYDVHALVPGDGVIRLGGIDIAHSHKLHGHSDADVVLHAIVDALLGSIAAGDIGSFFPPSDARWKGANSAIFIEEARAQVAARGGDIQHLDVTIIGERPKIGPHREAMRAAIAAMLNLPLARISVKATTTEKLGFEGREEGIAAHAITTVSLPMEAL